MSCVLRVSGQDLNIDSLLRALSLQPVRSYRRGESRRASAGQSGSVCQRSGANFDASMAGFHSFDLQKKDALAFLVTHRADIQTIIHWPGVDAVSLDFGIALNDAITHTDNLPAELLAACGNMGVGISLSHYPIEEDEANHTSEGIRRPADGSPKPSM